MSHTLSLSLFLSLSSLSFSPFSLSLSLSVPFSHSQIFSSSLHLYLYILLHILLDILLTFSGALNDIRRANTNENSKVSPENSDIQEIRVEMLSRDHSVRTNHSCRIWPVLRMEPVWFRCQTVIVEPCYFKWKFVYFY